MNSNRFFENSVALAMFALLAAFLCSHAKAEVGMVAHNYSIGLRARF